MTYCMVLLAGKLNNGQDSQIILSTAEVTVSSPTVVTIVTTSSSPTTVSSYYTITQH